MTGLFHVQNTGGSKIEKPNAQHVSRIFEENLFIKNAIACPQGVNVMKSMRTKKTGRQNMPAGAIAWEVLFT